MPADLLRYTYRRPRVAACLPVEFATERGLLFGITRDLSEAGLLVDFGEPVLAQSKGLLRLRTGRCMLELEARVIHAEAFQAGVEFLFASLEEKHFVRAFFQALSRPGTPQERPLA